MRNRASILSRKPLRSRSTLSRKSRNSALLTNSASIGGLRTNSFIARTMSDTTAAAQSSQVSIAPGGGVGICESMVCNVQFWYLAFGLGDGIWYKKFEAPTSKHQ